MPKATNGTKKLRIRTVYEMLLADTPRPDIIEYARKNWGIQRASVDKYIRWANDAILEESNLLQQESFAQHLAKRAILRHKALKDGDKRLAFEILRDESKLLGLYPAKESKIQNLDIDLSQLTDDQLQRIANGEDPIQVIANK